MTTHVQNTAIFVDAFHTLSHFLFEHIELPVGRHRSKITLHCRRNIERCAIECVANLFENPRTTKGGASHHHCIHTIVFKSAQCIFARSNISVADDGDVHTRIAFHFANERPIGFSCVHLTTGAPVDGQSLSTGILDAFRQIHNDAVFVIPT